MFFSLKFGFGNLMPYCKCMIQMYRAHFRSLFYFLVSCFLFEVWKPHTTFTSVLIYSNQLLAITLCIFLSSVGGYQFFDVYMILQWTVTILMLNEQRSLVGAVNFLFISSSYHKQQLLSVSKMRLEFFWFQKIVSTGNLLSCVFVQPQLVCMVYGYAILVHSDDTVAYYAR
jgi:hypothetical protein